MSIDDIRLSDKERNEALEKLGQNFADGRLTVDEFDMRIQKAAGAVTYGDLVPLFSDLPSKNLTNSSATKAVVPDQTPEATELESIRKRGALVHRLDAAIWVVGLLCFFVGVQLNFDYSWLVFLIIPFAPAAIRWFYKLDETDEKVFAELERKDAREKEQRLKQAMKRIDELER